MPSDRLSTVDEHVERIVEALEPLHPYDQPLLEALGLPVCENITAPMDLPAFDKTVEVNIRGYFYTSQQAARAMRDRGGGAIVNVASINGRRPAPGQGVYSMTKAAILSMTEGMARELGQ